MKKLMHILFLSCLKATELIEKKIHVKLLFKQRLQLFLHKMMCDACSMYEKQSAAIEKGMEIQYKHRHEKCDIEDLKKQISSTLLESEK
ncbi:MAG: hypothetical protein GQ525_15120 [Draconibacterium sp.]|nr:hypothetical protein [Draconibacterium sp.]